MIRNNLLMKIPYILDLNKQLRIKYNNIRLLFI